MSKLATNKFKWTFSSTGRESTRFGIVMIKSSVFCQSPFKIKFFATNITVYVHQHDFPAQSCLKRFVHNVDSQFALDEISWCGFQIPHLRGRSHYIFLQKPLIPSRSSSSSSLSSSSHHGGHVFYLCFCLFSIFSSFFQISNSGRLSLHCQSALAFHGL